MSSYHIVGTDNYSIRKWILFWEIFNKQSIKEYLLNIHYRLLSRLFLYYYVLFFSFLISLLVEADTLHPFSIAVADSKGQEGHNDDRRDSDNANEDFEEQNSIQICCTWGYNLANGILTYYIDKENSNKQQQHEVRNAIQEWDRNVDPLELEETSSKKNGDILIEIQKKYEGYEQEELIAGQSINAFDTNGFIYKVLIIVCKGIPDYKFDEGVFERIVKHEMGHVLGLGHANFDGNLMTERINYGTGRVSECEINAVLQANYWKFIDNGREPYRPQSNGIICNE